MFCNECGNKITDETKFCSKCGNKIIIVQHQGNNRLLKFLGVYDLTLGRKRYFIISLTLQLSIFPLLIIPAYLIPEENDFLWGVFIIYLFALVISIIFFIVSTSTKRIKDIGISKNWILLIILPYINIIFWIYLCVAKSKLNN